MARSDKVAAVAELANRFSSSAGVVLTEYRGLSVKALKELRRSLGDEASYSVSKNTLTTIAAREAGVDGIEQHLVGPTAIAFIDGDPVVVAKGLRDFARTNPQLVIKGGVLDGKFMSPDEVRRLADLESRDVLLAKVAGALQGVSAAGCFAGGSSSLAGSSPVRRAREGSIREPLAARQRSRADRGTIQRRACHRAGPGAVERGACHRAGPGAVERGACHRVDPGAEQRRTCR
jgi:ribosomal protein L10